MKKLTRIVGKILLIGLGTAALSYLLYQCPNQKKYRQLESEFQEYKNAIDGGLPNQQGDEYKLFDDFMKIKEKKKE
jgi:hypothetical protein